MPTHCVRVVERRVGFVGSGPPEEPDQVSVAVGDAEDLGPAAGPYEHSAATIGAELVHSDGRSHAFSLLLLLLRTHVSVDSPRPGDLVFNPGSDGSDARPGCPFRGKEVL
ncbi:hypothetical protein [Streptomyces sp. NPDC058463]|uniref:hypothetical protein n=1 Tax=Streptomyces sp. NPDC058463 TaxID=3346510 RepID=UPI00364D9C6A